MPTMSQATPRVLQPGEGTPVTAFGSEILFKLGAEDTDQRFTLGLATVPPGNGPPPHVHEPDDEVFIIIEGRYEVLMDGAWVALEPGSVAYLPRGATHTIRNVGETPGRHWVLTAPAGFERFYAKAAEEFEGPGGPDPEALRRIALEHGYRFLGASGAG
jgi:mannose-6-phosphate isomerase-like protein (cupin superfamily)